MKQVVSIIIAVIAAGAFAFSGGMAGVRPAHAAEAGQAPRPASLKTAQAKPSAGTAGTGAPVQPRADVPVAVVISRGNGTATGQARPPAISTLGSKQLHGAQDRCGQCHLSAWPNPGKKEEARRLVDPAPKLCYRCHTVSGAMKSLHAPVKEGMCTTCHDPHESAEPKLLSQPVKDLCLSCHPDKTGKKFMHGPTAAGDCVACHDPHGSANARLLLEDGAALCILCHTDMQAAIAKKNVHPALGSGCTSCHDPHGSAAKKFLSGDGVKVCFVCHPEIGRRVGASAKSVHAPIKSDRGCASCHFPHSSDAPKLLAKAGTGVCLDCHKDLIKKTQTVLHGPLCTRCHEPHGTPNEKLLIKPYSTSFYVSYTDTEFPLCFSCHPRDMLKLPTTSYATGFRDGEKNLHYIHVNRKDKGRRCKACHVVHAGENSKLIADRVIFGDWSLPLKFVKTETGGGCSPGCHQPFAYDRKNPAKGAPPAVKPEKPKRR